MRPIHRAAHTRREVHTPWTLGRSGGIVGRVRPVVPSRGRLRRAPGSEGRRRAPRSQTAAASPSPPRPRGSCASTGSFGRP
eukprot:7049452-Prymnesium_polylepis.2